MATHRTLELVTVRRDLRHPTQRRRRQRPDLRLHSSTGTLTYQAGTVRGTIPARIGGNIGLAQVAVRHGDCVRARTPQRGLPRRHRPQRRVRVRLPRRIGQRRRRRSDSARPPPSGSYEKPLRTAAREIPAATEDGSGYDRGLYFGGWVDADGDCHDTRSEVLIAETRVPAGGGCVVNNGSWLSPWNGLSYDNASDVDIDHHVPVAEAWRSGAKRWSQSRRIAYYNDLADPRALQRDDRQPQRQQVRLRA